MTIPNHITLDDLPTMPVGEIAALPGDQLALLQEDARAASALPRRPQRLARWRNRAEIRRPGAEARRAEGKDTGTVRMHDGPVTVSR
jgi:hypothetical protein